MSTFMRLPSWARIVLIALAALAIGRGIALVHHRPLLAFANSYDQVRYTTCLDLAPWRPGVRADAGSPTAPLSRFAFQPMPPKTCTWTSDLLITGPVALGWHLSEHFGGREIHSVRRLADFRLLIWFAVAFWATRAFLRENRPDVAMAHMAWLAIIAMDPANALYLSTFYAEAAAVFGFYVCGVGTAIALLRPTRVALGVTALGAALLATSKFQHLLLPVFLAIAVAIGAGRAGRRVALALLLGGVLGGSIQYVNGARNTPMAHNVSMVNRADFVLSVLLRETSDTERVAKALDLDETCASFVGKSVYAMPGPVDKSCTTVDSWRYGTMWWLMVSDPPGLARALGHIPALLLPWQPEHLGLVEGGHYGRVPAAFPQLSNLLGRNIVIAWALLLLPWVVFIVCVVRRAPPAARAFALMCAAGAASVPVVALLGDGDVEYAKHAHLTVDFALTSLCVPLAALLGRFLRADPVQ
ncbi:MAG: hypothetical protein ACREPX_11205 [Rhodanobacteraceae bacterium]